jgi:hypothetical protein
MLGPDDVIFPEIATCSTDREALPPSKAGATGPGLPMSRGWAQPLTANLGDDQSFAHPVVGIICASDFPDKALIGEVVAVGLDRDPHTVYVVRERDLLARSEMDALGAEYVVAPLNPYFKYVYPAYLTTEPGGWRHPHRTTLVFGHPRQVDDRTIVREYEIVAFCSRVIVFRTPATATLDFFSDPRWAKTVRVLERGKKKKKSYKKGKPTA